MASTIRLAAVVLSYNTLTQNQFSRVPRDRELGHDIREHRKEQRRVDRVEHGPDLIVARDRRHAEQAPAVRPALPLLQMALMRQERRALHEEHRKRRKVGHGVARVRPWPTQVGKRVAAPLQRGQKRRQRLHPHLESENRPAGNPLSYQAVKMRTAAGTRCRSGPGPGSAPCRSAR
jgi:hypothetical protein